MLKNLNTIQLKEGDVLHCTSNGWLAKLIKFFTKSKINHTALVVKMGYHLFIIDAQANGVNVKTVDEWTRKYKYKYIISRPREFSSTHKHKAFSRIGITGYDFMALLNQLWYVLTGIWTGKTHESARHRMYCSEFVAYVFNIEEWWKKSPKDVYEIMDKNTNFITIKR